MSLISKTHVLDIPHKPEAACFKEAASFSGYHFIKNLKDPKESPVFKLGLYENEEQGKVVIRHFLLTEKNLYHRLIKNEANILSIFNQNHSNQQSQTGVRFPKFIELLTENGEIGLVSEFIVGDLLKIFNEDLKLNTIDRVLKYFKSLDSEAQLKSLAKRKGWLIFLSFPFYFSRAFLKNPKLYKNFFQLLKVFISSASIKSLFGNHLVFAHRDLTSDNILIEGNNAVVIDLEAACLGEPETDLALFPRYFIDEIKTDKLIDYLKKELQDKADRKNFLRLTVYYAIQYMAISERNNKYHKQAEHYMEVLIHKIIPAL